MCKGLEDSFLNGTDRVLVDRPRTYLCCDSSELVKYVPGRVIFPGGGTRLERAMQQELGPWDSSIAPYIFVDILQSDPWVLKDSTFLNTEGLLGI